MPKTRRRKAKRPRPLGPTDPRSYPDTSLSPYTEEGRIQVLGNVLRAAKYGDGRRRQAANALLAVTLVVLLIAVALSLLQTVL